VSLSVIKSPLNIRDIDKALQNTLNEDFKRSPKVKLQSRILFPVIITRKKRKALKSIPEHKYMGKSSRFANNIFPIK